MEKDPLAARQCIQCKTLFTKREKESYYNFNTRIYCNVLCIRQFQSELRARNKERRVNRQPALRFEQARDERLSDPDFHDMEKSYDLPETDFGTIGNRAIEDSLARHETQGAGA